MEEKIHLRRHDDIVPIWLCRAFICASVRTGERIFRLDANCRLTADRNLQDPHFSAVCSEHGSELILRKAERQGGRRLVLDTLARGRLCRLLLAYAYQTRNS